MAWHQLELVNRDRQRLRLRDGRPILEQVEAGGISLPFGCRRGVCLTCTAWLAAGKVWHPPNVALGERERAAGYVLPCVAQVRGSCRLEVGAAIHSRLYTNPFKTGLSSATKSLSANRVF